MHWGWGIGDTVLRTLHMDSALGILCWGPPLWGHCYEDVALGSPPWGHCLGDEVLGCP